MLNNPWWYCLYNTAIWTITLLVSYNKWKKNPTMQGNGSEGIYLPLFFLFLMSSLFVFAGGDMQRYKEFAESSYLDYGYRAHEGLEPVYAAIAYFVHGNYYLWQMIVYGGALVLTYFTLKRTDNLNSFTILAFILFAFPSYGLTRGVLAYSIFLFGLSFFDNQKKLLILLGIAICAVSWYFHSSMILPILLLPFIFLKITKKRLIFLILFFPVAVLIANNYLDWIFINSEQFGQSGDKLLTYTDADFNSNYNDSFLMNLLAVLTLALVTWIVLEVVRLPDRIDLSYSDTILSRFAFILLYVAFVIRASNIPNNNVIYYRYLTMIPFYIYLIWPKIISYLKGTRRQFLLYFSFFLPILRQMVIIYYESFKG